MYAAAITGTGVFTPSEVITNDDLVASFNAYADLFNAENADKIASGAIAEIPQSSANFILAASGIERRHVLNRSGVLDPTRMYPALPARPDDAPGYMAEIGVDAAQKALQAAGIDASDIDLVICAASNMERAYPAIAVEIQQLLGAGGFAFDMNVACSSATFGIQTASDMIRAGSIRRALVINPEICSAHLEWRDRDCHFIFGDVATATLLERDEGLTRPHFKVNSTRCATQVFKEVLPLVSKHIADHLQAEGVQAADLKRLWLHQANKSMNDYIGKRVLGRTPQAGEQPNILQDYANTSSAGSIIAFSQNSADLQTGDTGLICSFGAGYSVGSVIVTRA